MYLPPPTLDEPRVNPNFDTPLFLPPSEAVTQLSWCPIPNPANLQYIAATSWANDLRLWSINPQNGESVLRYTIMQTKPQLSCVFASSTTLVMGGCNNVATRFRLDKIGSDVLVEHLAPVNGVLVGKSEFTIFTTSWDKMCKLHDTRAPPIVPVPTVNNNKAGNAIGSHYTRSNTSCVLKLADIPLCSDWKDHLFCVATADRKVLTYDLRNPRTTVDKTTSPLELQSRSVVLLPSQQGFVLSSVGGKILVAHYGSSSSIGPGSGIVTNSPFFHGNISAATVNGATSASGKPFKKRQSKAAAAAAAAAATSTVPAFGFGSPLFAPSDSKTNHFAASELQQQQQHISKPSNYIFKAHTIDNQFYAINKILWNPVYQCLTSLGSDGTYAHWDLTQAKLLNESQRMVSQHNVPIPITTGAYSPDGRILAYVRNA